MAGHFRLPCPEQDNLGRTDRYCKRAKKARSGHAAYYLGSMSNEPNKIIYSMVGVSKSYDKKVVLRDIYLSYFYSAKIGVLGLNASGKSSLLRIIAGVDTQFDGQVSKSPGFTVGFLEQEPKLDESKTVRQIVEQGAAKTIAILSEFNA